MRRHFYERLEVTGTDLIATFDPSAKDGLGRAVKHLEEVGRGKFVWLRAMTKVKVANYRWPVNSLLSWEQVEGKTEDEIWRLLDSYTDKHIEAIVRSRTQYPIEAITVTPQHRKNL